MERAAEACFRSIILTKLDFIFNCVSGLRCFRVRLKATSEVYENKCHN